MASFIPNMIQKYVDLHAQPIPDYPQPLRVTFLNHKVWFGKYYGTYAAMGNFGPAVTIIGAYMCWPYITSRYQKAKAAAAQVD